MIKPGITFPGGKDDTGVPEGDPSGIMNENDIWMRIGIVTDVHEDFVSLRKVLKRLDRKGRSIGNIE